MALQALLKVLLDMMHLLPSNMPAKDPQMPYSAIGLPPCDSDDLRGVLLTATQGCIRCNSDSLTFGCQALPVCAKWLVEMAASGMDSFAKGQDIMPGPKGRSVFTIAYARPVCEYFQIKSTCLM